MQMIFFPSKDDVDLMAQPKPNDWAFMEQSGEVLKDIPETWSRYPKTENGMKSIIEMEFEEFMQTEAKGLSVKDRSRELVHLASACLYLWRYLNNVE